MFQAKVRWRRSGERGTKYFHGLKNRNSSVNVYKSMSLHHSTGEDIFSENVAEMLKECHTYFSKMFTVQAPCIDDVSIFLENLPCLTPQESEICEGNLTELELKSALFSLKDNKSPGPNGFTVEFYKYFWNELKEVILNVVQEIKRRYLLVKRSPTSSSL